jgi:cytidylate kinase
MKTGRDKPIIGVVGPCGSGKSTLIAGLKRSGIEGRHIAQEHSYVATMWRRLVDPDVLVYLEATFETATRRRKLYWTEDEYQVQLERLKDARQNADLIIETDPLKPENILQIVQEYLKKKYS